MISRELSVMDVQRRFAAYSRHNWALTFLYIVLVECLRLRRVRAMSENGLKSSSFISRCITPLSFLSDFCDEAIFPQWQCHLVVEGTHGIGENTRDWFTHVEALILDSGSWRLLYMNYLILKLIELLSAPSISVLGRRASQIVQNP